MLHRTFNLSGTNAPSAASGTLPCHEEVAMIQLVVRKVKPEHVDLFRNWMGELNGPRRDEALATFVDEGCTHERVLLIEGADGPVVVYAMEVESVEQARNAAETSKHSIDAEHRAVLDTAIGERVEYELLLDLR
jgi:pyridoxine/pyridoxamine 5'-phosphate oxidase